MEKSGDNPENDKDRQKGRKHMSIFDVLSLLCGLALFLYGMDVMGDALKKSAGNQLKTILGKIYEKTTLNLQCAYRPYLAMDLG